jgi:osmotically-inducible protein OsmY
MHAFGSVMRPRSDRDIARMVKNGWVTLTGEVEWGYQKRLAVPVIKDLTGIVGVTDNLIVKYGPVKSQEAHSDAVGDGPDKRSSSRWN